MVYSDVFVKGIFFAEVLLIVYGYPMTRSGISGDESSCLKIKQVKRNGHYIVRNLTAKTGEQIMASSPTEEFFLPDAPRKIHIGKLNTTHAHVHMTPSRAGLNNLKYYMLQIVQEARGPKVYIQYRLLDIRDVQLKQGSSLNYSCIVIHPNVYRMFVKVWALSGETNSTDFKKSKYSVKMSNYLSLTPVPTQDIQPQNKTRGQDKDEEWWMLEHTEF